MTDGSGAVRAARLTDRQALAALSRRVHASPDGHRRSLGVPAVDPARPRISLATLIPSWLPLRSPSVHLVAEVDGELVGSARAITEPHRSDWVIIELDADDGPMSAEVRWALLTALVAEGTQQDVARLHVACADAHENLELFGQAGFVAYAQEQICYRPPEPLHGPGSWFRSFVDARRGRNGTHRADEIPASVGAVRPAGSPDALASLRPVDPYDAARHRTGGGLRRRRLGGRRPRGGRPAQQPQPAPPTSGPSERLGDARRPSDWRLRAARRQPRGPALSPLSGSRRRDGAAFLQAVLRWPAREAMPSRRASSLRCEHMSRRAARRRPRSASNRSAG